MLEKLYFSKIKDLGSTLICLVVTAFHPIYADEEVAITPWLPPHIHNELNDPSPFQNLAGMIQSDALSLASSASLELLRLVSFGLLSSASSGSTAWFFADSITRLADAAIDYSLSEDYSDFAARALFSNLDKLPWLGSGSGYARLSRRAMIYLYIFRRYISRYFPTTSQPRLPTTVYLHDPSQDKMLHIVMVPPGFATEYDPTVENASYFIVSGKDDGIACDLTKAATSNPVDAVMHQLNCQPSVRIHLYPRQWLGENRLFIRLFKEGMAGPLYMSPYSYGEVDNSYFFNHLIDEIEQAKNADAGFNLPQESYFGQFLAREQNATVFHESVSGESNLCYSRNHSEIENPLDEKTFALIHHLLKTLPNHSSFSSQSQPLLKEAMADAVHLEELAESIEPEPAESIESIALSLISGGKHSFLVIDHGDGQNRGPLVSLETRYSLASVARLTLDQIDKHRSETLSENWWLACEAMNLVAMQLLSGMVQNHFSHYYTVPVNEEGYRKATGDHKDKVRQAANEPQPESSPKKGGVGNRPDQSNESKRPRRDRKPTWKLREDNEDVKPPEKSRRQRKSQHHQPDDDHPRGLKKFKDQEGGAIVTKEADEPGGTLRKRNLQHDQPLDSTWTVSRDSESNRLILRKIINDADQSSDKQPDSDPAWSPVRTTEWQISFNNNDGTETDGQSGVVLPRTYRTLDSQEEPGSLIPATSTAQNQHGSPPIPIPAPGRKLQDPDNIQPDPVPANVIFVDEPRVSSRYPSGETKDGFACPVIGCNTRSGKHERFSVLGYWWGHIKVHAGITYDGRSHTTSHTHGEDIMAKQQGFRCQVPGCNSVDSAFDSPDAFGRHLATHGDQLDQQTFNQYQLGRLLQVARALGFQVGEEGAPFRVSGVYRCGIEGCEHSIKYLNDQNIYKKLVSHRDDDHKDIAIGHHSSGPDLSEMTVKSYRYLAKKYQTRFGLGWFCTKCKKAAIRQFPEALGDHFKTAHLQELIFCPVKNCNDPVTGERTQFAKLEQLYGHHMMVHQPAYIQALNTAMESADTASSQISMEHSYCLPLPIDVIDPAIVAEGWVRQEDLDLSMLKCDEVSEELNPGGATIEEYQPH